MSSGSELNGGGLCTADDISVLPKKRFSWAIAWMKRGSLETVDKITNMIPACGLFDDGKVDMAFRSDAGLVLLDLFFLPLPCLRGRVNRSRYNVYHDI